jgi:hypothetical protein
MADGLNALSNVFTLTFVVTSMFSMGLGLTVPQIVEPLRNVDWSSWRWSRTSSWCRWWRSG